MESDELDERMEESRRLDDIFAAQVLILACQLRQYNAETRTLRNDETPGAFIRSALREIYEGRGEILSMWQHGQPPG
jgi:hypothetical protein